MCLKSFVVYGKDLKGKKYLNYCKLDNTTTSGSISSTLWDSIDEIGDVLSCMRKQKPDVNFQVQCGEEYKCFPAHKLILSVWSPKLADLFYGNDSKIENAITVDHVLPTVFEAMLKFMYGSKADLHLLRKDVNFILNLYKVASDYEVEALKVSCFELLVCTTPNSNNVFDVLKAGEFLNSEILQKRCMKTLQSETGHILVAQDLSKMTLAMILTILNLPRVSLSSEFELAMWTFAWAKNRFLNSDKDFRSILLEVLPFVKLTSLSAQEFGELLMNHKDSISERDGFSIFMNIVLPGSYPLPTWCVASQETRREYNFIE